MNNCVYDFLSGLCSAFPRDQYFKVIIKISFAVDLATPVVTNGNCKCVMIIQEFCVFFLLIFFHTGF